MKFHQRQKRLEFASNDVSLKFITERDKEEEEDEEEEEEDKESLSNNSGVVLVVFFIFCLCAFAKSFRTLCVVVRTFVLCIRGGPGG